MKAIRAFVGHSFTSDDEQVVGKFLKYLDAIEEVSNNFSWEHAERPEPSGVDDKVLRMFEDKNVFIAICTRKELVIDRSKIRNGLLRPSIWIAGKDDYKWKTSDWIIQEIGLAFGRGLDVILLVEEGVRSPGGLQGALEYISFKRSSPELAFGKLLRMVASLSAEEVSATDVEPSQNRAPDAEHVERDEGQVWLVPDHTWHRRNYEHAFMHYTAIGDRDKAAEIESAFRASTAAQSDADSWPAFVEYMRLFFSKGGQLATLKGFAEKCPYNSKVIEYLARAYRALGEDQASADSFLTAAELEEDPERKLKLLGNVVDVAVEKHADVAERALNKAKAIANSNAGLATQILSIESSFSKARKERAFVFGSLERLVELRPDDHSKRFDLAYAYAEAGMSDMALFHYHSVPSEARDYGTWNNLGVAYENQRLPIKAIYSYKESKELGNTLAMSNLSYRFLHAGFLDEARSVCEEAAKIPDHHQNVDTALATIKGALEAENEAEKKVLSIARDCSMFYRNIGVALIASDVPEMPSTWIYEGTNLNVSISEGAFSAQGSVEENAYGLRRLHADNQKPDIFDVTIRGTLRGRAATGTYEKKRRGIDTILGAIGADGKEDILLFISEDGQQIEVLRGSGEKRVRGIMKPVVKSKAEGLEETA